VVVNCSVGVPRQSFEAFAASTGERVRRALVASYGVEIGSEAAAEAMTTAWERWAEIESMANPAGFLFRVGQSRARPHLRWARRGLTFPAVDRAQVEGAGLVELFDSLAKLRPEQRTAVLMVKSYGFSYREVAEVLGVTEAAVTNHVHRGLALLRSMLEVQR
jgi:DNA-directed RNA polymerase specialized sigma24 family protein